MGGVSWAVGGGLCFMHVYKLQPHPQFDNFLPKTDNQEGMNVIM